MSLELGIIGNCSYSALIDPKASILWLCWPRFDSSPVFGALLDHERGGCFSIRAGPEERRGSSSQHYLENTNVLRTEFRTAAGSFEVIDFAPRFRLNEREFRPTQLVRIIRPISGRPLVVIDCAPSYDYGAIRPRAELGSNHIEFGGLPGRLRLTTSAPLTYVSERRAFILDRPLYCVLSWGEPFEAPLAETCEVFLEKTKTYWRRWVKHCTVPAHYQEAVIRSALVLKLHQFEDTGAILAATTTSIPEAPGTGRTWDYRYCWLRDAYFTLSALRYLGQFEELERFVVYLRNLAARHVAKGLQPVYGIDLERDLTERQIETLAGYRGEGPVRVGNAAYLHKQFDIYGEMILAIAPLFLDARFVHEDEHAPIDLLKTLVRHLEHTLLKPDAGLWEFRGKEQLHTFTVLMHWLGGRETKRIAAKLGDARLGARAEIIMRKAARAIERQCWSPKFKRYTQAARGRFADAALFSMLNLGYLKPDSARARLHVDSLAHDLVSKGALTYRYRHPDDFGTPKTVFTICGFWYVEALARLGRLREARKLFESYLRYRNHLGLMSEDLDPRSGELWGNFPQTYSHVGLINCAFQLGRI